MYAVLNVQAEGSSGFLERLEWLTEVGKSRDGSEVRVPVRAYPRYRYEYSLPAYDDATRAILGTLRTHSGLWLAPLWPHITAGANRPAVLGTEEKMLSLMADGSMLETTGLPAPEAVETMPAALARLTDAPRLTHKRDDLAEARVAFVLVNFQEAVGAWDGATIDGKPVWPFSLDWTDGVEEEVSKDAETVDFGILWEEHVRFTERTHTATVALMGAEELATWRRFLWAVRGQHGEFWMQGPGDAAPTLYRLATDQVETAYRFGAETLWATSKVSFKRLGESV